MNPEQPIHPREEFEAKLTALLLGELPADEAFALGRLIEQDAELAKTFERLKQTIKLVKETEAPVAGQVASATAMKISAKKREALLQQFKTVKPTAFAAPKRRNLRILEIAAVLAILAILGAMLLPALSKAKARAQRFASTKDTQKYEIWDSENTAPAAVAAPPSLQSVTLNAGLTSAGEHEVAAVQGQRSPTVNFANSSRQPSNGHSQTGAGSVAMGDERSKNLEPPIQRAASTMALSAGGGGGAGAPARNLRAPIVLPASNEVALQNVAAPEITIAAKFADVTQNDRFGVEDLKERDTRFKEHAANQDLLGRKQLDAVEKEWITPDNRTKTESRAQTNMILAGNDFSFYKDFDANGRIEPNQVPKSSAAPIDPATGLPIGTPGVAVDPATGLPLPMETPGTPASEVEQRYYRINPAQVTQKLEPADSYKIQMADAPAAAGGISGDVGGIRSVTRTNDMAALQDGVRQFLATNGVILDSTKGESVYYGDRSGTLIVSGTSQNKDKIRSLSNSFGDLGTVSTRTTNYIVLPSAGAEFSFNTTPQAPTLNYNTSTIYRSLSTADMPRGATALMEGKLGEESHGLATPKKQASISTNAYTLGIAGYAGTATTSDTQTAERMRPYLEAQRKLDELQRFDDLLKVKQAAESGESRLPKSTMVEIMDEARPATKPSTSLWAKMTGKPAEYESKARIAVNRDTTDIASANATHGTTYDPYFIQSEFETIGSTQVLGRVVSDLRLDEKWGKDGQKLSADKAVSKLKSMLDVKAAGTGIELGVKDQKANEAAEIANAVAKSYSEYRRKQANVFAANGVVVLQEQIADQEKKIHNQEKFVAQLRQQLTVSGAAANAPAQVAQKSLTDEAAKQQDQPFPKPATPPPTPQPEVETAANPFSTFSLNVSDVSFKLAAASLEKGALPDPASIRSEEFINAFDYRDPEPPANVPIAFASERAQYPFAQNRDLLRFSVKTAAQGREAGKPLNLVLLVDNSGSMERADRVRILRESLHVLASELRSVDKLSILTFARTPHLRVDGIAGDQAGQATEQISSLTPEGGTNLEEGMNLAYETARRHYMTNGVNRVVLMTDGAANLGDVAPESLKQKVEANRKQGIALDCFGIGWEGYNDDLLETLSRNGDGRYGFINSPEAATSEFAAQLAGALNVAASDVKVQVEFNPKRVTAYRQIGYAKHQLTKEQFRDNTVDAAEIGAAEAGNALYVIETNPSGEGPIATVRVRFKVPGTAAYREHEWTVAYAGAAAPLEQATPAMRLATAASAFSEWLATSPYAGEVTPDALLHYLSGVPEVYGADGRPKKLEWMVRQAKTLAGK